MNRFFILALACALALVPLSACSASEGSKKTVSLAEQSFLARNAWQADQKLLRVSIAMEVVTQGQPTTVKWMFVERTPSHRLKVIFRSQPDQDKDQLTYLNHDGVMLVMKGEDVTQPVASWMVGTFVFGQNLDPNLLLSWVLGVPGKSYSVEEPHAEVSFDQTALSLIQQEGWSVRYHTWKAPQGDAPSLPQTLQACKGDTCLNMTVVEYQAHTVVPADYTEFKII